MELPPKRSEIAPKERTDIRGNSDATGLGQRLKNTSDLTITPHREGRVQKRKRRSPRKFWNKVPTPVTRITLAVIVLALVTYFLLKFLGN